MWLVNWQKMANMTGPLRKGFSRPKLSPKQIESNRLDALSPIPCDHEMYFFLVVFASWRYNDNKWSDIKLRLTSLYTNKITRLMSISPQICEVLPETESANIEMVRKWMAVWQVHSASSEKRAGQRFLPLWPDELQKDAWITVVNKKRETGRILNKNIGIVSALYRKRMLLNFEVCNRITLTMTYKYYKNPSADDLTV